MRKVFGGVTKLGHAGSHHSWTDRQILATCSMINEGNAQPTGDANKPFEIDSVSDTCYSIHFLLSTLRKRAKKKI